MQQAQTAWHGGMHHDDVLAQAQTMWQGVRPHDDVLAQPQLYARAEEVGATAAVPQSAEPHVLYLLLLLQREREQLKNQTMQNELLMQTVFSSAQLCAAASTVPPALGVPAFNVPANPAYQPRIADHATWGMSSAVQTGHPRITVQHDSMDSSASASTIHADYTSDDSESTSSSGKRKERGGSTDSESALTCRRKRRIYVKSACNACRASHLACDSTQPCRNCARSGCRCERTQQPKVYVPPSVDDMHRNFAPAINKTSEDVTELALLGRKYVKAACACCRRSHLACDNYRPCRNCMRMGLVCEEVRSSRRADDQSKSLPKRRLAIGTPVKVLNDLSLFSANPTAFVGA